MESQEHCIFCKIVSGQSPAKFVYDDESIVAFHDIHPIAPVHLLIIPKEHIPSLNEATDTNLLGNLFKVARELAREQGIDKSGYRTIFNCQRDGGQIVYHLHLHLVGGRRLGRMG